MESKLYFIKKFPLYMNSIRIWESLFALPFAYIAIFLASIHNGYSPILLSDFIWITLAMFSARTFAMSFNRLANEEEDNNNPRTKNRHLQTGSLNRRDMWTLIIPCGLLFVFSAFQLNILVLLMSPIALIYIAIYSIAKYHTWLCNVMLGTSLAIAPIGAWLGVTGTISAYPFILGLAVALWASGFDIIYACLDFDFDKEYGTKSVPTKFGIPGALIITKVFHGSAILMLIILGMSLNLNILFFIGCTIASLLLAYENTIVKPTDLSKVNIAFFRTNGIISMILLIFTIASWYAR
jgi:4-hydroxybenzoate polyprenyltransferase